MTTANAAAPHLITAAFIILCMIGLWELLTLLAGFVAIVYLAARIRGAFEAQNWK
jgi:hypothetical protein